MAFSPRSRTTFGLPPKKEPSSAFAFDLNSFVRQAPYDERDKPVNTAQYSLWRDITRHDISNLQQIDDQYNSNMWKNFKFVRSKHSARNGQRNSTQASEDMIAVIYPLTLPNPSKIGENSYDKFLKETKWPPKKQKILDGQQQGMRQKSQSRILKVQSECRAPPTDWEGNILPPTNYKRYPRPKSILSSADDWRFVYPSYSSTILREINYTLPNSPYSRNGTPWHYGLRVRRSWPDQDLLGKTLLWNNPLLSSEMTNAALGFWKLTG